MNSSIHPYCFFSLVFRKPTCSYNTWLFLSGEVYKMGPDQLTVFKRETCSDPPPLKNHKAIGFLRSPEKSQSNQASIQCCAIICLPVKHHLNGVSLAAFSGIWILSPLINYNKKGCQPLTTLSGSTHEGASNL